MEQITDTPKRPHHGKNIKRIREFFGVKQEAFAKQLGPDWSQGKVSSLEDKETIEPEILELAAKALNVTPTILANTTEEMATNFFNNYNFHEGSANQGAVGNNHSPITFNPLDKLMEVVGKNEALYEQLLKVEREKNELLERLLKKQ
ncbi:helix-turn-helix domain-containing protein [Parachryseolinea silvisoli]|uniref:helix-turn-helix domain-containing protein n=1 Tax=Parachryseolinea silvisoli TaxID=2873601 RepID=UPI002265CB6E|nr:helix-turn-helix transcriptional regulator [Parachryseolinea silvisoli]MCD9019126.1 helix-turn-helix domain-containing protein [Parachryseolinea silvisoli]